MVAVSFTISAFSLIIMLQIITFFEPAGRLSSTMNMGGETASFVFVIGTKVKLINSERVQNKLCITWFFIVKVSFRNQNLKYRKKTENAKYTSKIKGRIIKTQPSTTRYNVNVGERTSHIVIFIFFFYV